LYYQRHLWSQSGCRRRWILVFVEVVTHQMNLTLIS
jgi:hypothetical protein